MGHEEARFVDLASPHPPGGGAQMKRVLIVKLSSLGDSRRTLIATFDPSMRCDAE